MTREQELSVCPRCGREFECSKSGKCWCYSVYLPPELLEEIEKKYDRCLCPGCLDELSKTNISPGNSTDPSF